MNWLKRFAFLAGVMLLAPPSLAQLSVIVQPGTVTGSFFHYGDSVGAGYTNLYTVPASRYARLTDVIATASSTSFPSTLCYFQILSGSALHTAEIVVPPQSTIHIPFNNGPAFGPGEAIVMTRSNRIAAQCPGYIQFTVRGYLFTVP
jgi:hypothetical protein